jgi:hypothetical protein
MRKSRTLNRMIIGRSARRSWRFQNSDGGRPPTNDHIVRQPGGKPALPNTTHRPEPEPWGRVPADMASKLTERVPRVDSHPYSIGRYGLNLLAPTDRQGSQKARSGDSFPIYPYVFQDVSRKDRNLGRGAGGHSTHRIQIRRNCEGDVRKGRYTVLLTGA